MTPELPESKKLDEARSAVAERKIVVLTLDGEKVYRFDKDRIVIGSVVSADVRLAGDGIAPIHAVLEGGATPTVYDLASETGVFLNGAKVITQALKEGDVLTIGHFKLEFRHESPKATPPLERYRESQGRKLFYTPGEDLSPLLLEDERAVEEIFDYRPSSKQALEVVMSWNEVILDVRHFVSQKRVVLGASRKSDFAIPAVLTNAAHPLVTREGDSYTLHLDSRMTGVVQRKGQLQRVGGAAGGMIPGVGIPLEKDDFAKLTIGDIDFYLSFTAAPPRLKLSGLFERDPLFVKIFASSLVLTAITVFSLLNMQVPTTLEAEQIPERIATILYQPEKYTRPRPRVVERTEPAKPEPVAQVTPKVTPKATPKPVPTAKVQIQPKPQATPRPVPKEMHVAQNKAKPAPVAATRPKSPGTQGQAKEGRGARAKGTEGTRGTTKAPVAATPQNKAARPSPQGGPGGGDGASEIADIGNVDFMKAAGGKIENILANSAVKLGKGGERLKGFGGFDTRGSGGLALSGSGTGGGGTAEGLGGLSDQGKGGGRVGTGMGAAGSGTGIVGGQARVVIRSGGPEEAVVMGSIDADAVEAALLAHRDEFRQCYEREINATTPDLSGRVSTTFVIGSSGKVNRAAVESTTLKNANAENCILTVIKRILFPIPRGAGIVQVSYPFKFVKAGR